MIEIPYRNVFEYGVLSDLRSARRTARSEQKGRKPWGFVGSRFSEYVNSNFYSLIDANGRSVWRQIGALSEESSEPTYALDIGADVTAIEDLVNQKLVVGGAAISLGMANSSRRDSVTAINGNILTKKTWRQLDSWMQTQPTRHFGTIFSRMYAGIDTIPATPDVYYWLANQVWTRLSPSHGIAFIQSPDYLGEYTTAYHDFLKSLGNPTINFTISHHGTAFRLERFPGAPEDLPTMPLVLAPVSV